MKLYESESKQIFLKYGLTIPKQVAVIEDVTHLDEIDPNTIEYPVIVKAMILIGGRGKSGGVKKANNLSELKNHTNDILGLTIHNYRVNKVIIEEAVEILHELYVSVTTDPGTYDLVLVVSASGGVDIEGVAKETPNAIWKKQIVDNSMQIPTEVVKEAVDFLCAQESSLLDVHDQLMNNLSNLFAMYQGIEAKICEINPLIVANTAGKKTVVAADAKVVIDDNSLYRQASLLQSIGIDPKIKRHDVSEQTLFESRAYDAGFPYVDLLEDPLDFVKDPETLYVGLVPGGAGYGIFSIDEVVNIGNRYFNGKVVPINFMDSGGGPPLGRVAEMFHLLMDHPATELIITSRFGGISSCDIFIQGLIMAIRDRFLNKQRIVPVFGRMVGTDLSAAAAYLEKAKAESPEELASMQISVGNEKIMADVIKEACTFGFSLKQEMKNGGMK